MLLMDPDVTWEWYGMSFSCVLLGGFEIGAVHGFHFYDSITRNVSVCTRSCSAIIIVLLLLLFDFLSLGWLAV